LTYIVDIHEKSFAYEDQDPSCYRYPSKTLVFEKLDDAIKYIFETPSFEGICPSGRKMREDFFFHVFGDNFDKWFDHKIFAKSEIRVTEIYYGLNCSVKEKKQYFYHEPDEKGFREVETPNEILERSKVVFEKSKSFPTKDVDNIQNIGDLKTRIDRLNDAIAFSERLISFYKNHAFYNNGKVSDSSCESYSRARSYTYNSSERIMPSMGYSRMGRHDPNTGKYDSNWYGG